MEPGAKLQEPFEFVWTPVAHLFGERDPDNPAWTEHERATIQVGFAEHLESFGLEAALEIIGFDATSPEMDFKRLANENNAGKDANPVPSFQRAHRDELAGVIIERLTVIEEALGYLHTQSTGRDAPEIDPTFSDVARQVASHLVAGLARDGAGPLLPALNIPAKLHAAIRWDRGRRFKPTDWLDTCHASAALPYCDMFMTDRSLAALIVAGHVRLDQEYGCIVTTDARSACDLLSVL
jgi:hypothetical protein